MFGEKITIGGIEYDIEDFNFLNSNSDHLGKYLQDVQKIYIEQTLSEDLKNKTTAHEILHGIVYEYGADIPEDVHEKIVSQLTTGFYEVAKQIFMNGYECGKNA